MNWPKLSQLFGVVPVVLACLALGVFGSCNAGMAIWASNGETGLPILLIGLLSSLIVSVWVGLWLKNRYRGRVPRFISGIYAAVWILVGVLCFAAAIPLAYIELARAPFRWDIRQSTRVSFLAKKS